MNSHTETPKIAIGTPLPDLGLLASALGHTNPLEDAQGIDLQRSADD